MSTPLLEVTDLSKAFGATQALGGISLRVERGEIVALLGHNGSGKSTFVKILSGVETADSGEIDRRDTTVHVIHQTLGLIESLSAIENIDLARRHGLRAIGPFRSRSERAHVEHLLARFDAALDPTLPVGKLTPAQRTIVAVVRALDGWGDGDHLLVLDEPTATLHDEETTVLLDAVRSIAAEGVGIIYISHRLAEVQEIADRAIVLRDGLIAAEFTRGAYTQQDLLDVIAGEVPERARSRSNDGERGPVVLRVEGLAGPRLTDFTQEVRAGEVLGIAGVIGSGMEQVNALIFGATAPERGAVFVDNTPVAPGNPRAAVASGIGYLPPDRLLTGGIATHSIRENVTLPRLRPLRRWHGGIGVRRETDETEEWMDRVRALPTRASHYELRALSGGNQQKVLLAKWLRLVPRVLLLDEPTQGVDVGAQGEIYALLREAAGQGAAVVIASSDTHELAEVCDRIIVLQDGRISAELTADGITEAALIHAVLGDDPEHTTNPNLRTESTADVH